VHAAAVLYDHFAGTVSRPRRTVHVFIPQRVAHAHNINAKLKSEIERWMNRDLYMSNIRARKAHNILLAAGPEAQRACTLLATNI
jgi:hypothetical protein